MKKSHKKTNSTKFGFLLLLAMILCTPNVVNGQTSFIKNGVNIQASYFNRGRVNLGWELMETYPEIEAVRIEIEPYRSNQAIQWIREAHKQGYQVIATYHNSQQLGSNKVDDLIEAANWWRIHYKSFIQQGPVIINLMNEWGDHTIQPEEYAAAYNEAIAIVREVYDGPLIIDVPGFGQATEIAADAYNDFNDQQIIFSVHLYSNAFNQEKNRWLSEEDLTYLATVGANCMVGEFCDAGRGGTDWCSLIDYCYKNGWPIFGWAWNGDGGTMNMIEPHWRDEPLATSFNPTPYLDKIINKLAGVPCFTIPNDDCDGSLIGTLCDDGNDYTINDRYNEFCHCTGRYTTTLNSILREPALFIYPNPVGLFSEITIEFIKLQEQGVFAIYSISGQQLKVTPIQSNDNRINIDVSDLPDGIYWATFKGSRNTVISSKFIK